MANSVTTAVAAGKAMLAGFGRSALDVIYPPRCLACPDFTDAPNGLCAACWRETHFITGSTCAKCGAPLLGEALADELCDGCRRHPPAWDRGAAALLYRGAGSRMVLGLKYHDRLDTTATLAGWMVTAGRRVLAESDLLTPVPVHWTRLLTRRFNQSAELGRAIARLTGKPHIPDLLRRPRVIAQQKRLNREERAANQIGAVTISPRHAPEVAGRSVLVIDDVLTTGATLGACAEALRSAGAAKINILVLSRVAFGDSDTI